MMDIKAKKGPVPNFSETWLLVVLIALLSFGLVMVGSTSMEISQRMFDHPFHYLFRQSIHLVAGLFLALFLQKVPMQIWQHYSLKLLGLCILMLVLVLVPGIGKEVNGASRWIGVGGLRLQVSEAAKLIMIIYLSRFLVQYSDQVKGELMGFLKPLAVVGSVTLLLLLEPDFGASVVICSTAMALLYLGGVRIWTFLALFLMALTAFSMLAITSPYRLARLTTFLNPWSHQFDSGYQLTQSLIAFGRGGWYGTGLGESIQKLFYLPESHTDFIFAVIAEELGLIGGSILIGLLGVVIVRGMMIGHRAHRARLHFNGFCAQGISIWFAMQACISIGVNSGVLPTKGLTLPLISYGGSSMVVNCVAIALLFRIAKETNSQKKMVNFT